MRKDGIWLAGDLTRQQMLNLNKKATPGYFGNDKHHINDNSRLNTHSGLVKFEDNNYPRDLCHSWTTDSYADDCDDSQSFLPTPFSI